jgi:hypothetical protein
MGAQALLLGVRGPHLNRYTWLGYAGGIGLQPNGRRADTEADPIGEEKPGMVTIKVVNEAEQTVTDVSALAPTRPPLVHRRSAVDRPVRPPMVHRRSAVAVAAMSVLPAEAITAVGLVEV